MPSRYRDSICYERSGAGETNPYGGQADSKVLTAREG